jgi:hypothetical protein
MPHDGSLILSDVREPTLALVCETRGPSFEHSAAPTFMVFDIQVEMHRRKSCKTQSVTPLSRSISAFAFDHPLTGVTPFVVNTRSQRPILGTLSRTAIAAAARSCAG